jgi:hypothetical protein
MRGSDPLKVMVAGNLPPRIKLINGVRGIDQIKVQAAIHELHSTSLALEVDLFAGYTAAQRGGKRFLYSQVFGCPGTSIGLLFLCTPELREDWMFIFGCKTETDAEIDQCMGLLETVLEQLGTQYCREACLDPKARIHVISDREFSAPLM